MFPHLGDLAGSRSDRGHVKAAGIAQDVLGDDLDALRRALDLAVIVAEMPGLAVQPTVGPELPQEGAIAFRAHLCAFTPQVLGDRQHSLKLRFLAAAQGAGGESRVEVAALQRQDVDIEDRRRVGKMTVELVEHLSGHAAVPELLVIHQREDRGRVLLLGREILGT